MIWNISQATLNHEDSWPLETAGWAERTECQVESSPLGLDVQCWGIALQSIKTIT